MYALLLTLCALFATLAGRVVAFNITVGSRTLATTGILAIPDSPVKVACSAICTTANGKLAGCNDDANCLCRSDTVAALLDCETCMLHFLIAANRPAPDFRAGSNPVLSAYAAACKRTANITLSANQTALQLPKDWDGPFVAILPLGGAIVTVIVGGVLGLSALFLLSNLE